MKTIIVCENPKDWNFNLKNIEIVKSIDYLTGTEFCNIKGLKVFNFCKSYKYQTIGYYVSLIAEAREHFPLPSVSSIQDISHDAVIKEVSYELDQLIQKSFKRIISENFELSIYFGKNLAACYNELSKKLFNLFSFPFFKTYFVKEEGHWNLKKVKVITLKEIAEEHHPFALNRITDFIDKKHPKGHGCIRSYKYKMAILYCPTDKTPPSDKKAIEQFKIAAEKKNIGIELIDKNDYAYLDSFDALFIRNTTSVNHFTYKFARKAEAGGLVVIDDPSSILKCTNKIYLNELLLKKKILMPKSIVISKNNLHKVETEIGFPCVVKIPDSSFSLGVFKYDNADEFHKESKKLFAKSELLLVQAFIPTKFDWRVGILNSRPIFACRYYMVRKHWQIYDNSDGAMDSGGFDTVSVYEAPYKIIETAIKASNLIGNGLYGVDLKEIDGVPYVIEINDNPSIDYGVEDKVSKKDLYETIIDEFIDRIDRKSAR